MLNGHPSKLHEVFIDLVHGQSHHRKVRTVNFFNAHHAQPILGAIGTGFVKRHVLVDIKMNLLLAQCFECYFCPVVEEVFFIFGKQADGRNHSVGQT